MTTNAQVNQDGQASVDLDHHGADFRGAPYEFLRDIRSKCPVAHSSEHGGFWILTDYDSVYEAARDDDLFSSAVSVGIPASGTPFPILPIETDPPETQQLRAITLPAFSPKSGKALRPGMHEIATELIDAFIESGSCDLVKDFTTPLTARVLLRMMDFDESTYESWVTRVHSAVHDRARDLDASMEATGSMLNELAEHMELRRDREPTADLYSRIVHGTLNGEPLNETEIVMYGLLMMFGGMDTTSGFSANVFVKIAREPELRARLLADTSALPRSTEEFLRFSTPQIGLARSVTRDCEFKGQKMSEGDMVLLSWAAANRDPEVFENPEELDLDRVNTKHMTFGVGAHRCLGSNLARDMFEVMLEEVLTRIPDFELVGEPVLFADAAEVYAFNSVPITFSPGQRSDAV
ncbi:MAG: putative cytochrome [Marmoricola sp.]|nr:putative cytochrome [Marmoricola sp.]